jgi:hypothetical protein
MYMHIYVMIYTIHIALIYAYTCAHIGTHINIYEMDWYLECCSLKEIMPFIPLCDFVLVKRT